MPGGNEKVWVRLMINENIIDREGTWEIRIPKDYIVKVKLGDREMSLRERDGIFIENRYLVVEGLRRWMGYRVYYNPALIPMAVISFLSIISLAWSFYPMMR